VSRAAEWRSPLLPCSGSFCGAPTKFNAEKQRSGEFLSLILCFSAVITEETPRAAQSCATHHQMNENGTQIGALALDLHDFSLFSAFFVPFAVYFHEEDKQDAET
jgi:hypothetical protein